VVSTTLLVMVLSGASGVAGTSAAASGADVDATLPSARDVAAAEAEAADRARTVVAVRTDMALADQRFRSSSIAAAVAAEAFNTARWQLSLARQASRAADLAQQIARRRSTISGRPTSRRWCRPTSSRPS